MANAEERDILDRVERIASECSTLRPPNPAHVKAIMAHSPVLVECSRDIARTIRALRYRGYADAREHLAEAEQRLAEHRARTDLDEYGRGS